MNLSMLPWAAHPSAWCGLLLLLTSATTAAPIRFDFGDGSVDANTGVAANSVIGENDAFATESFTLDDVTITLNPVGAAGSDFATSQWGANSQGIGIRSRDAGGSTSVDSGSSGGQRRRIAGSRGEAIEFSFDTDVTIESVRLGSLAPSGSGDVEVAEISFVSGDDPFGGSGVFSISSDTVASTSPIEDLPVNVFVSSGTVLSVSTNAGSTVTNGILFNDIVVSVIPEPASFFLVLAAAAGAPCRRFGATVRR